MTEAKTQKPPERAPLKVDLALQGGGSHGAFAWGALDRLLDYPWMEVEGISGTSAGAMNAAVFAYGMMTGGHEGARAALADFWKQVSDAAKFSPFQRTPWDKMTGNWSLDHSPAYIFADTMSRFISPFTFAAISTPVNPLRGILEETIDFEALANGPIKLFITATNARTGRGRVFRRHEITADVLLASACLPTLFQPVEIDGEYYWDGGFSGNPTITPLVRECESRDTFLVQINPVYREEIPQTAREILNRVNEVSFNATLLKELRMVAMMRQVADPGNSEGRAWAEMRLHRISSDIMVKLSASSKLNAEWAFLEMLRDEGRAAADAFAAEHRDDVGVRSSFEFESLLEGV
ncbi:patatin-like phospholipase family protein [Poseidonocella sp. HB161398]|uniref:patatin-like phospholipase family protein n=1 Tax=Poseidonocella sp. HB161398 TaxID=2320855 RepID=UPI00110856EB|nr:patatin-like phospholipase family protein [Poseidonocella sp. HB161398]